MQAALSLYFEFLTCRLKMCDTDLKKQWGSTKKAKLSITKYVQLKTKGGFREGGEKRNKIPVTPEQRSHGDPSASKKNADR